MPRLRSTLNLTVFAAPLACFTLAAFSLADLEDTHGRDLDFLEED